MTDRTMLTLHRMTVELAAMSQNGLFYATDSHDVARWQRLRIIAAELMGLISEYDPMEVHKSLTLELGHATPKVAVRSALFEGNRVLLVRERQDLRWALPGGWADALDEPSVAAEREFAEEAGLRVKVTKLAAVYDGQSNHGHSPANPWHIYKMFFIAARLDDATPVAGLDGETSDVAFFDLDELPILSTPRTTESQLRCMYAHHCNPLLATEFD